MGEVKILMKCACGQEEAVPLDDMGRVFDRRADGQEVIVEKL